MSARNHAVKNSDFSQPIPPVPPPRIVQIHGATRDTVRELADKHGLDYEFLPSPRTCSSEKTPSTASQTRTTTSSHATTESTRYYRSSRDYYYYDSTSDWLCWCWLCLPSRRGYHHQSYGYDRDAYQKSRGDTCTCSESSSSDCDSSSDDAAGIIAIIVVILLVGVVIALLPEIVAISAIAIGLLESAIILLFNIITLGLFHDELSRTRIAVYEASEDQMKAFYKDLAKKKAVPDVPGLYTSGFMWLRVGAFLLVPSLIGLALAFFLGAENRIWYWMPASVAAFSLLCIVLGYLAILRKSSQIKNAPDLQIWW